MVKKVDFNRKKKKMMGKKRKETRKGRRYMYSLSRSNGKADIKTMKIL